MIRKITTLIPIIIKQHLGILSTGNGIYTLHIDLQLTKYFPFGESKCMQLEALHILITHLLATANDSNNLIINNHLKRHTNFAVILVAQ